MEEFEIEKDVSKNRNSTDQKAEQRLENIKKTKREVRKLFYASIVPGVKLVWRRMNFFTGKETLQK